MFPDNTLGGLLESLNERRASCTCKKQMLCIDRAIKAVEEMMKRGVDYRSAWIVLVCLDEGGLLQND